MDAISRKLNRENFPEVEDFLGLDAIGSIVSGVVKSRGDKKNRESNEKLSRDNIEMEKLRLEQARVQAEAAKYSQPKAQVVSPNKKMYWIIGGSAAGLILIVVLIFALR